MDPRMMMMTGSDEPSIAGFGPDGVRTVTPELLLGRHYSRIPGGILSALTAAAEYEGNPGWGSPLDPSGYGRDYLVSMADTESVVPNSLGLYYPEDRTIQISELLRDIRPVLEHEATHAALMSGLAPDELDAVSTSVSTAESPDPRTEYLTEPSEMDVRLAEAKRLYAREKGVLVDTPEKAADAWEYYKGRYMSQPAMDTPTMKGEYETYEEDPLLMKEMLQRMPGVVDAGDAIRSLIYG